MKNDLQVVAVQHLTIVSKYIRVNTLWAIDWILRAHF
jgi:hypothetical protein